MTTREILASDLAGRRVADSAGRYVGRITELAAEIELHATGNDYVVREVHVSSFGALEWLSALYFIQQLAERLGPAVGYRCVRVPWESLDLSDVEHPRMTNEFVSPGPGA